MFLLAALSLGFLGSFHCIGMCGPIALAIPTNRSSNLTTITGIFVYNLGRVTTYSFIGLLFGLMGQGFVMAGLQSSLSITLGVIILLLLFLPNISIPYFKKGIAFKSLEKIKSQIRKLFGTHTTSSLLMIGMLNGLLPCGLVYLGIAGSMSTGNFITGALFMAAFGFGTFPAMISVTLAGNQISLRTRQKIRRVVPVFVGTMAVLLILRGMNLGIPYVSPSLETASGVTHLQCCHK